MRNTILKSMLAMGIIAFAVTITAVSCGKTAGGNNNNNNNNNTANTNTNSGGSGSGGSGNGGSGGGNTGCTGICPTTNLIISTSRGYTWIKTNSNTVIVNATGLAGAITPHSDANDNNRGYDDALSASRTIHLFNIEYPGATAVLYFFNRASVSTNSITMPTTLTTVCSSSETSDNTLATSGNNTCREYTTGGRNIDFYSYLGTVFNNTDAANRARGVMRCASELKRFNADTSIPVIDDTVAFNRPTDAPCWMAVVNSAGTAAAAEIDDAWVGDTASTTEVELHAIGINVSGKTIPQFSSEAGYGLTRFITDHDNAAFKRLLQTNPWGELKFKVKIVAAANF